MIVFEDGEMEIALLTYNRPAFVKIWLEKCFPGISARNISLSIYDSSTNDETQDTVRQFDREHGGRTEYHKVDSKTIIGYKPMLPILQSRAKYLWVSGDSRYHDFDELDKKVFPSIKNKSADYIVFNVKNNYRLPDSVYDDLDEMLSKVFVPSTCIGLSIYNLAIFESLRQDKKLQEQYDRFFYNNYGFSWLGYFYSVYAAGDYKTLLVNVKTETILDLKKKQSWAVRFYGCWCDDLCQLIDRIPERYSRKNSLPRAVWEVMKLDDISSCLKARVYGDLNVQKYNELIANGLLDKITAKRKRIKFFASAPLSVLKAWYFMHRITYQSLRRIKRLVCTCVHGGKA